MNLKNKPSQRDSAVAHLQAAGMSRLSELTAKGITAATVSRLEREGVLVRLARGLYQLADASLDVNHTLAEASKLVPKGVICLTSSLAFHGLTDQIPAIRSFFFFFFFFFFSYFVQRIARPPRRCRRRSR